MLSSPTPGRPIPPGTTPPGTTPPGTTPAGATVDGTIGDGRSAAGRAAGTWATGNPARGRQALGVLLAALLAVFAVGVVIRPAVAAAAPVRIMPLGDSITAGPGCWRAMLWQQLRANGYANIDFVGSQNDGGACGNTSTYDPDHEGHSGFLASGIAGAGQLPPWLAASRPDVVLMHLGTNDVWSGHPVSQTLAAFTTLVGQMRASNPAMKILVAQILPMNPASCSGCAAGVVALDQALPAWAAGLTTAQSPITLVDQWTGFDVNADTIDGVHPNTAGFQKMAARWYPALAQALNGTTPTPTPTATTPTTTPTTTPGTGTCTATYSVVSQWQGGFQGQVVVRNDSTTAATGWTATFTFTNGQQVTQSWNTTLTQSGATVTARNVSYNGALAPAASTSFGFLASWNGTNTAPTVRCTLS